MRLNPSLASTTIVLFAVAACSQTPATPPATAPQTSSFPGDSLKPSAEIAHTSTPRPTETPTPTATIQPTSTIDADPAVYDNFANPANDGFFNQDQWRASGNVPAPIVHQQDGMIMFSDEGNQEFTATVLVARNFDGFQLDSPMYFQADLMLSPESGPGDVNLSLYGLDISPDWFAKCFIQYTDEQGANCMHASWDAGLNGDYSAFYRKITPGHWHTFRIEVRPETMEFAYYIDGVLSGKGVPLDAERLRGAEFQVVVGIDKNTPDGAVIGFADNVRIGAITP